MSLKSIIPIALGLMVAVLVYRFMPRGNKDAPPPKVETVDVVVADGQIARAMEITEDLVTIRKLPKGTAPPNCYHDVKEVIGKAPVETIHKGWPVGKFQLAEGDHLVNMLKGGKRLVPLKADQVTGATHLLKPGDHVDLLYMGTRTTPDGTTERFSNILLQDVELLAVGLSTSTIDESDDTNKKAKRSAAKSVALALTLKESARLHLAETTKGKIRLVGRSKTDSSHERGVLITERELWEDRPRRAPVADAVGGAFAQIADALDGVRLAIHGFGQSIENGLRSFSTAVAQAPEPAVAEVAPEAPATPMTVRLFSTGGGTQEYDFTPRGEGQWQNAELAATGGESTGK